MWNDAQMERSIFKTETQNRFLKSRHDLLDRLLFSIIYTAVTPVADHWDQFHYPATNSKGEEGERGGERGRALLPYENKIFIPSGSLNSVGASALRKLSQ